MLQNILSEPSHSTLILFHKNFSTFSLKLLSIAIYTKLLEIKYVHGFSTEIND